MATKRQSKKIIMEIPKMPVRVAAWILKTGHLDATVNGAYWFAILNHWGKAGIPCDNESLRQICRVREVDWGRVKGLLKPFFVEIDGMWVNTTCIEEFQKEVAVSMAKSQGGQTRATQMHGQPDAPEPDKEFRPTLEHAMSWLAVWLKCGADYTESEVKSAFHACAANGWQWGKSRVMDHRSAIERRIAQDRSYKNETNKPNYRQRPDRNEGTLNANQTNEQLAALQSKVL